MKLIISGKEDKIKLINQEINLRETEMIMLINLMDIAASSYKKLSDINICANFIGIIQNLNDDENNIEIDRKDLENLKKGLELSAKVKDNEPARPNGWYRCTNLLRQLDNLDKSPDVDTKKE